MKLKHSRQIFEKKKKSQISNFIKIPPVGAELFHAEGNFANAPKNVSATAYASR